MSNPLEDMLRALADPAMMRKRDMQAMCQEVMQSAVEMNMAGPAVGRMVRCVFSEKEKAFDHDTIVFETGRVYEVVANGLEAFDMVTPHDDMPRSAEHKARARASMVEKAKTHPDSLSLCVMVRDPVSGATQRITFPSYPGFVFVEAAPGEVDDLAPVAFKAGDYLLFDKLVEPIADGNFVINQPYEIFNTEPACDCGNPECPGKGMTFALIKDKDGDTAHITLPYSHLGIASIISAKH